MGVDIMIQEALEGIKGVFLDLDGTLVLGQDIIPGADSFVENCREKGIHITFLSNNSSRSVIQYVEKMDGLGIKAREEEILLSTHDLISHLKETGIDRCWLIGTDGMREMLEEEGISTQDTESMWVVMGYDTEMTYQRLATGCIMLNRGAKLIASHPDIVCPSSEGNLPDVGAMLHMIEATTGIKADIVTGKPRAEMLVGRMNEAGLEPQQCAMIGDRIYTDMMMAKAAGVRSILVLTGEASREDVERMDVKEKPDFIVDSVEDLF